MKKLITTIQTLTLATLCTLMLVPAATASSGNFTIYPTYMHGNNDSWIILDAESGKKTTDAITLENLTNQKQTIYLEAKDATPTKDSFVINDQPASQVSSQWISFPQSEYTLEPKQKVQVPIEISVPQNIERKEYTNAILASQNNPGENVNIVTRIGIRTYINVIPPSTLQASTLNSLFSISDIYWFLSVFALAAAAFYTVINYLDHKKYAKNHA